MPNPEIRTTAIIPAFNEAERLSNVVQAAFQASLIDAVIVVDDGSTDNTFAIAEHVAKEAALQDDTPFAVEQHAKNQGKTEALITGIDAASRLGGTALGTLVFLDADSSPIWSRDTPENMKLWQTAVNRLALAPLEPPTPEVIKGRENAFIALLARYIDEIAKPVIDGDRRMSIGMYERNVVTDTAFSFVGWGGHAGNRALRFADWEAMLESYKDKGVSGWKVEAALNNYFPREEISSFIMRGVVNVGSRKKTGSLLKGVSRMAVIHGQALMAGRNYRQS